VLDSSNTRALVLVFDSTAITSTPSVVPTIDGIDVTSGKTYNLLTGVAIATVLTRAFRIAPLLVAVANLTVQDYLPEKVRITMTHGNANSITYSVSAHLIQ
jgi:hypothetical protein